MPAFTELSKELQMQIRTVETVFQKEGKLSAKEHAFYKKDLKETDILCGAVTPRGKVCTNKIVFKDDGSTNKRCRLHGGYSGGPRTAEGKTKAQANLRPKKGGSPVTGLYSDNWLEDLSQAERDFLWYFQESIRAEYKVETSIEEVSLNMLSIQSLAVFRMNNSGKIDQMKSQELIGKYLRIIEVMGWRKREKEVKVQPEKVDLAQLLSDVDEDESEKN